MRSEKSVRSAAQSSAPFVMFRVYQSGTRPARALRRTCRASRDSASPVVGAFEEVVVEEVADSAPRDAAGHRPATPHPRRSRRSAACTPTSSPRSTAAPPPTPCSAPNRCGCRRRAPVRAPRCPRSASRSSKLLTLHRRGGADTMTCVTYRAAGRQLRQRPTSGGRDPTPPATTGSDPRARPRPHPARSAGTASRSPAGSARSYSSKSPTGVGTSLVSNVPSAQLTEAVVPPAGDRTVTVHRTGVRLDRPSHGR